jgi:hypothetical protein
MLRTHESNSAPVGVKIFFAFKRKSGTPKVQIVIFSAEKVVALFCTTNSTPEHKGLPTKGANKRWQNKVTAMISTVPEAGAMIAMKRQVAALESPAAEAAEAVRPLAVPPG